MEFRILGPLEVWRDDVQLAVAGHKPRALLAMLLLHDNVVVPADQLFDALWGSDPPQAAAATLRLTVSRLRKAIATDRIATIAPGYLLHVQRDELDLHRFERLLEQGRHLLANDAAGDASERLGEALSLWRGPPLPEFADYPFAGPAITRIEESRLSAVELRLVADLALGRHAELIGQLRSLVAEFPLRERLRGCLMTALYRSGRQAEALDAYQDARRVLLDELGIEPSQELRDLEQSILRQEHELDPPAPAPAVSAVGKERSVLVAVADEGRLPALLAVAEPLVRRPPRTLILATTVTDATSLGAATARLEVHRGAIQARGLVVRAATFTSAMPGADLGRLSTELDVELLVTDAPDVLLSDGCPDARLAALLRDARCDVAFLVARVIRSDGPVLVPFGGSENDWSAIELGAWLARAGSRRLCLAGTVASPDHARRDASRLLSHASLAVQRVLGVPAEPLLTEPGADGILTASRDCGLLVVGLSTRWRAEGLGSARLSLARRARPPTVFIRRGLRLGGLAAPAALTRFTWSIGE